MKPSPDLLKLMGRLVVGQDTGKFRGSPCAPIFAKAGRIVTASCPATGWEGWWAEQLRLWAEVDEEAVEKLLIAMAGPDEFLDSSHHVKETERQAQIRTWNGFLAPHGRRIVPTPSGAKVEFTTPGLLVAETPPGSMGAGFRGPNGKPVATVLSLLDRFSAVVRRLAHRSRGRNPLVMTDEYDVQYLLEALLAAHFDDIIPEEVTPTYAGRSSRIDFVLRQERIAVEVKFARSGHDDGAIGEELIIDKERYRAHPRVDTLICLIFDPNGCLRNPAGLVRDIEQPSNPTTHVVVQQ